MVSQPNVSVIILRSLHRIHKQLTDLRERLERGPKQIHAREVNVKHQEELLAQGQAEFKTFRVATDAKQLQFKSKEEKGKELRVKLNTATSNREYQALKDQIAADEMANSVLADEILEALEKVDSNQAKLKEMTVNVAKAKEELQRMQKEVADREPGLRADVQRLETELQEAEAGLPEEIRDVYQRMVRQKGEEALAPVVGDMCCGGCNQQITVNMYNNLALGHPIFCKACGRLLYLSESN